MKVFFSCGTAYTDEQEQFLKAVEYLLRENNFVPQTVGCSNYSGKGVTH